MGKGSAGDPQVSVIIPVRNAAASIGLQLEALLRQSAAPRFEVIVVDNRSTDGTVVAAESWRPLFAASERVDLRLVSAPAFAGTAYARNAGIRYARGDKLLFCDGDDCVGPYWVSHSAELLERCEVFSGSALPLADDAFPHKVEDVWNWLDDKRQVPMLVDGQAHNTFPVLMGGCFGIRKAFMLELGGFDHSMGSAGEDNEFALRIRASGRPILGTEDAKVAYRTRTSRRAIFRSSRAAGVAHALNAERYGLWAESVIVGRGHWLTGFARACLAAVRMLLTSGERDHQGLSGRLGVTLGALEGGIRYRLLRRIPAPQVGLGMAGEFECELGESGEAV